MRVFGAGLNTFGPHPGDDLSTTASADRTQAASLQTEGDGEPDAATGFDAVVRQLDASQLREYFVATIGDVHTLRRVSRSLRAKMDERIVAHVFRNSDKDAFIRFGDRFSLPEEIGRLISPFQLLELVNGFIVGALSRPQLCGAVELLRKPEGQRSKADLAALLGTPETQLNSPCVLKSWSIVGLLNRVMPATDFDLIRPRRAIGESAAFSYVFDSCFYTACYRNAATRDLAPARLVQLQDNWRCGNEKRSDGTFASLHLTAPAGLAYSDVQHYVWRLAGERLRRLPDSAGDPPTTLDGPLTFTSAREARKACEAIFGFQYEECADDMVEPVLEWRRKRSWTGVFTRAQTSLGHRPAGEKET